MGDRYLPPSTKACRTDYSKPCAAAPEIARDVGERAECVESMPKCSNHDALPSVCQIVLPWPPSNNHYYAVVRGRKVLAKEGRQYRDAVLALAWEQQWPKFDRARLAVTFEAWMPDRRRRDLDNLLKSLCDALTFAGVWHDDQQIDDLRIYRAPCLGGMVKARITATETP